jgi:hypothetical protein
MDALEKSLVAQLQHLDPYELKDLLQNVINELGWTLVVVSKRRN